MCESAPPFLSHSHAHTHTLSHSCVRVQVPQLACGGECLDEEIEAALEVRRPKRVLVHKDLKPDCSGLVKQHVIHRLLFVIAQGVVLRTNTKAILLCRAVSTLGFVF